MLLFGLFTALLYAATITPFAERRAWPAYLRLNAEVCATILGWLGEKATAIDRAIVSPRSSLLIERGCDAVHPSALFAAAVLASPVAAWAKLPGIVLGTLLLMLTNLIRIISLFYIQIHFPRAFELMHVEVWQALFIFFALALWAVWASWALSRSAVGRRGTGTFS